MGRWCTQHVIAGRLALGGSAEPLDKVNQRRGNFRVAQESEDSMGPLDFIADMKHATPADSAAFRTDMTSWMDRMPPKKRAIIGDMMTSEDGLTLTEKHKVTRGRISQIRSEAKRDWEENEGSGRPVSGLLGRNDCL